MMIALAIAAGLALTFLAVVVLLIRAGIMLTDADPHAGLPPLPRGSLERRP